MQIRIRRSYDSARTEIVNSVQVERNGRPRTRAGREFILAYLLDWATEIKTPIYVFRKDNSQEAWIEATKESVKLADYLNDITRNAFADGLRSSKDMYLAQADKEEREMFAYLCGLQMDGNRLASTLMEIHFLSSLGRDKRRTLKRTLAAIDKAERMLEEFVRSPFHSPAYDVARSALSKVSETLEETIHRWSRVTQSGKRGYKPETPLLVALAKYAEEQTGQNQCRALSVLTGQKEDSLAMQLKRAEERPELQKGWRERLPGEWVSIRRASRNRKTHAPRVRRVLGAGPSKDFTPLL